MAIKYKEILAEIDHVLSQVDEASVDALAAEICDAGRIVVFGAGRMGFACRGFAMRLAHMDFDSHFLGDATVPAIAGGDLLIVASGSGETASVHLIAETAKKNGADVALVTSRSDSRIARLASLLVVMPAPSKVVAGSSFVSIQPLTTLNEQCIQILFDCLVLKLMERCQETSHSMWLRHSNLE